MHSHTHAHTATHTHIPELKFSSIDIKPCTLHTPPTTQAHCVYFLSGITSSNERDHACALGVDGQRCVVSRHCEWWQEPVCVYHCATPAILNVIPLHLHLARPHTIVRAQPRKPASRTASSTSCCGTCCLARMAVHRCRLWIRSVMSDIPL
jgi:hypothetical protein